MIPVALSVAGWLVAGASGAPVDAFAPLPAALALKRPGTLAVVVGVLVLAPLAAIAIGDPPVDVLVRYAVVAGLAHQFADGARRRLIVRVLVVGGGLLATVAGQHVLATAGAAVPPSATLTTIAVTTAWAGMHDVLAGLLATRAAPVPAQAPA